MKNIFLFIVLFFSAFLPEIAYPCSCIVMSENQHLKNADIAFIGKFKKLAYDINGGVSVAIFDVEKILKGETSAKEVSILSGPICKIEWRSEPGTTWTVYTNISESNTVPPNPILRSSLCGGTSKGR